MRQIVNICVSALLVLALSAFLNQAKAQFSGGGGSPSDPPEKTLSAADLQKACDGGNAVACSDLGVRYVTGDGVAKDAKTSATLFQRGCDGGDAAGCFDLAENYRIGYGVTKNINNAAAFYLRACDGKVTRGCVELAVLHGKGAGVPKDLAKSGLYADRGCKGGSAFGCAILGAIYIEGAPGYPKDNAKAKKLLVTACFDKADFKAVPDSTSQVACPELTKLIGKPACQTDIYLGGPTTVTCFEAPGAWKVTETSAAPPSQPDATAPPHDSTTISNAAVNAGNAAYARQDFATAAAQYAAACDAGNASACGALGDMFVKGEGVKPSGARAAAPLAKACDAGIASSCGKLGVLYDNGNGVSANKALAFKLFSGACAQSEMASCYNQGRLYESGQGTGANVALAAALYQKACTAGIADGCVSIGSMYANGVYFGQDEGKSLSFYQQACTKSGFTGCQQASLIQAKVNRKAELAFARAAANMPSRAVNSAVCAKANTQGDNDLALAEQYARQGIKLNDPYCMHMMGWVNENRQDYELAYAYYLAAANKNLGNSIGNIGGFFYDGRYVERNFQTAIAWYKRALALAKTEGRTSHVKLLEQNIANAEQALRPPVILNQGDNRSAWDRTLDWQNCMQTTDGPC